MSCKIFLATRQMSLDDGLGDDLVEGHVLQQRTAVTTHVLR